MTSNELRIGNLLFNRFGEEEVVELIDSSGGINGYYGMSGYEPADLNDFKPILLTEEWLLKFGFEKGETYDFGRDLNKVPIYNKPEFDISIMLSKGVFWYTTKVYDGGTSEPYEPFIEVNHVHQLQNLFHALTMHELTIK